MIPYQAVVASIVTAQDPTTPHHHIRPQDTYPQHTRPQGTLLFLPFLPPDMLPQGTHPLETIPQSARRQHSHPQGTLSQDTLCQSTRNSGALPQGTRPPETTPQETRSLDIMDTRPQHSHPQGTLPQDTLPQSTRNQGALPQGPLPRDTHCQHTRRQGPLPQGILPRTRRQGIFLQGFRQGIPPRPVLGSVQTLNQEPHTAVTIIGGHRAPHKVVLRLPTTAQDATKSPYRALLCPQHLQAHHILLRRI